MKPLFWSVLLVAAFVNSRLHAVETEEQAAARKVALDLAGAFSNDGFKLRDGHWKGPITTGKAQLVQVNLYAGNQYWFSVGATAQAKKLAITIFDETGAPVTSDPYAAASSAAAGFSPVASGPYYLKIVEIEGEAATFCLLYSYK